MSFTALDLADAILREQGFYGWPLYRPIDIEVNGETYHVELVDLFEGDYDSNSNLYQVIRVDGRLFKKDGYYRSHEGSYWEGSLYEVEGVEKLVKVWERT